jgi:hypothetical protein
MSSSTSQTAVKAQPLISLDTWAVMLALAAAVLVRTGVIHRIPW